MYLFRRALTGLLLFLAFAVLPAGFLAAAEPCHSGLQAGQRPGPYAFVLSTGPQRGVSHCYICETGEHPAVLIFARDLSDGLGKLAQKVDKALIDHKKADLRGWITFLDKDQLTLDPKLVEWSRKHALHRLPIGTFEDEGGPPSYHLSRDADVTVLLFVKEKIVANFAFRKGELNAGRIAEVMKALPQILPEKQ